MESWILVVEDDQEARDAMLDGLELKGYRAVGAAHGRQALELLREAPRPFVILLDLRMPVMDGGSFRQAQRSDPSLADIPVILISSERPVSLETLAPFAVVPKPIDVNLLLEVIAQ